MAISLSCVTWVPILWGQLRELFVPSHKINSLLPDSTTSLDESLVCGSAFSDNHPCDDRQVDDGSLHANSLLLLPDDIIMNIFSRLSAVCVLQCLRLCRSLYGILSSPSFVAMHLCRAPSLLVVQYFDRGTGHDGIADVYARDIVLHFIDGCEKFVASRVKLNSIYINPGVEFEPFLFSSYKGLLLFKNHTSDPCLFIWNPITQEQVTLISFKLAYAVCGLFYHTPTSEFRVLYICYGILQHSFFILSLGTKLVREISYCGDEAPNNGRPPIILNGALHWMVCEVRSGWRSTSSSCLNSILLFRVESEDFVTISHPEVENCSRDIHRQMKLLEMEGHLGLCYIVSVSEVRVWMLEEKMGNWAKNYSINTMPLVPTIWFDYNDWLDWSDLEVFYIDNDELLLKLSCFRLHYYHLKLKTFRPALEKDDLYFGSRRQIISSVVLHSNSVASLHADEFIFLEDLHQSTYV